MRLCKRRFSANSSGQLLIVAALVIAILVSSTTIYVYEVSRETHNADNYSISDFVLALRQSTKNAVISSLVNVSNGGEKSIFETNLNNLSEVFRSLHQWGMCHLSFTLLNNSNYDSGIWLSWNTSGLGVSSAYADYTLKVYSLNANITMDYAVNLTTAIAVNGYYTQLAEEKLVNLTCRVYNEEGSALAKRINVFYEELGSWTPVDSSNNLSIMDYGNGTYLISFTVEVSSTSVQTSVHVYDFRDIFARANMTCYEV